MSDDSVNLDLVVNGIDHASGVLGGIGNALGGVAGVAGGVLVAGLAAATAGLVALGAASAVSLAAALDGEKQQAALGAVLKSTGDISGLTQAKVNELATQFRDLAGGSDEAIVSIETIGIRSGAISAAEMPRFIKTVADLGSVMGDTSAAANILARAQEDPVAAMGKLQRAGILFNDTLSDQIKTLAKAGDATDATALIMDRVSKATMGDAAAAAGTLSGQWEIFTNHIGDAGKGIATSFLPVLHELFDGVIAPAIPKIETAAASIATFLSNTIAGSQTLFKGDLPGMFANILYSMDAVVPGAAFVGDAFLGLVAIGKTVINFFTSNWSTIQATVKAVWNGVEPVLEGMEIWLGKAIPAALKFMSDAWTNTLLPGLKAAGGWIEANLFPVFRSIGAWLGDAIPVALKFMSDAWTNTLLPGLKAAGGWIEANLFPVFKSIATWLGNEIPVAVKFLGDAWNNTLAPGLKAAGGWIQNELLPLLVQLGGILGDTLSESTKQIGADFSQHMLPNMQSAGGWIQNTLMPTLGKLWQWIKNDLPPAIKEMGQVWNEHILPNMLAFSDWYRTTGTMVLSKLGDFFNLVMPIALKAFGNYWNSTIKPIFDGITFTINNFVIPALHLIGINFDTTLPHSIDVFLGKVTGASDKANYIGMGVNIIDGIDQGMRDNQHVVVERVASVADAASAEWVRKMQIHSPSKVFAGFGANMMQGLALGIDSNAHLPMAAAAGAAQNVSNHTQSAIYNTNYNLTANYAHQPERTLADTVRLLQAMS